MPLVLESTDVDLDDAQFYLGCKPDLQIPPQTPLQPQEYDRDSYYSYYDEQYEVDQKKSLHRHAQPQEDVEVPQEYDRDACYEEQHHVNIKKSLYSHAQPEDDLQYATIGELVELKMWCSRLALIVQNCCQPQNDLLDTASVLQEQKVMLENLTTDKEEMKSKIDNEFSRINDEIDNLTHRFEELPERLFLDDKMGRVLNDTSMTSYGSSNLSDESRVPAYVSSIGRAGFLFGKSSPKRVSAMKGSRNSSGGESEQGGIRFKACDEREDSCGVMEETGLGTKPLSPSDDTCAEEGLSPPRYKRADSPFPLDEFGNVLPPYERRVTVDDTEEVRVDIVVDEDSFVEGSSEDHLKMLESRFGELGSRRSTNSIFNQLLMAGEGEDLEYTFSASVWDASLVLFFRFMENMQVGSCTDKLSILIAYAGTMFMQFTLIMSIYIGILDGPFPEWTLREMRNWRENQANQTVMHYWSNGSARTTNQATLMCENKLWSWEQTVFNDAYDYTRPKFDFGRSTIPGTWLGFLCVTVWVCCVFKDFERWTIMLRALIAMHMGVDSVIEKSVGIEKYSARVHSASFFTRLAILVFVMIPRFFVISALLYVGCKWISQTHLFEDIIINCVALMFVLNLDELLYVVILPAAVRKTVEGLEPIPLTRFILLGDVEIADLIRWILIATVLFASYYTFLDPFFFTLEDVTTTLCPNGGMHELHSTSAKRNR